MATKKATPAKKAPKKAAKKKRELSPALKAWHTHLMAFKNAHPDMKFSECMKKAKLTYKK